MKKISTSVFALALLSTASCSTPQPETHVPRFPSVSYTDWSQGSHAYKFYPGDQLNISFQHAPELDKDLVVAPDGRISLPLMDPVVVADLSVSELQNILERVYTRELVDPSLTVTLTEAVPQKVFIGGEVASPGVFDLPGQIDPLQAIVMAGGLLSTSKPEQVIILRRGSDGKIMTRVVDVKNALKDPNHLDIGPLQRFDVVYVSRKRIANQNLFVDQFILSALPIDFSFFYDIGEERF